MIFFFEIRSTTNTIH